MKLIVSQLIFISILGAHFVQLAPLFGSEKGLDLVRGGITGISSIPGSLSKGGSASKSAVRSVKGKGHDSDESKEYKSFSDEKSATTATDSDQSLNTDLGGDNSDSGLEPMSRKDNKTRIESKKGSGSSKSEDGLESVSSLGHKRSGSIKGSASAFDTESASNKQEKLKYHSKHNSTAHPDQHNHQGNQDHSSHHSHHNSSKTESVSDSELSQKSGSEGEPVDDFYESISAALSSATTTTTTTRSPISRKTTKTKVTTSPSNTNITTTVPETVSSTESNVEQSKKNVTTAAKNLTSFSWPPSSSSSSSSSSFASTEKPLSWDYEDDSWSDLFAGSYWDKSKIKARAKSKSTASPSTTTTSKSIVDINDSSNDTLTVDLSPVKPSPKMTSKINTTRSAESRRSLSEHN